MMTIFLLFSLFSVGFSQQLLSLSYFNGDYDINELNLPAPYSIYISANGDRDDLLSNIYIVDQDDKQTPLSNLKNNKKFTNSGELEPYVIQTSSYVTSKLTNDQMKTLTGVMYISTPNQVKDNNFHVIDIDNAQNIQLQGLGAIHITILFLNTHMNTNPINSAIISNWQQNLDASVSIYTGFPLDSIEPKRTYIFSNPMQTDNFIGIFPTVEKFSLPMVAFYMRTYKGVNFRIEPGYFFIGGSTTSAYTTTGLYAKPISRNESPINIFTKRNANYSGSTGANIIGHLSPGAKVTVAEYGGVVDDKISTPPNDFIVPWSTPNIGDRIEISSGLGSTGRYYVQYFVDQGQLNSATTSLPGGQTTAAKGTTRHNVETTTKSSGTIQILISFILSFMVFIGFY